MSNDERKKPENTAKPARAIDDAAGRMRRLADAIVALLDNPIKVRMHELWGELTAEERRRAACDPPDHIRRRSLVELEASERKLEAAERRRKELHEAYTVMRLDLQEHDAVFLERVLSSLPPVWVEAHDRYYDDDDLSDEVRAKLRNLAGLLQWRADRSQSEAQGSGGTGEYLSETVALLAQTQRTLSSGVLLKGDGTKDMTRGDYLLFNFLCEDNPQRKGWALSYREIADRLNVSHTKVDRMRHDFEARHRGTIYVGLIAKARQKNDKGKIAPELCDSGRQIKTKNPPENPSEAD